MFKIDSKLHTKVKNNSHFSLDNIISQAHLKNITSMICNVFKVEPQSFEVDVTFALTYKQNM